MYIEGNSAFHRLSRWFLNALSLVFKTLSLVNLKRKALRKQRFPAATIVSIDNLSFGGTGKTTLVIEIGEYLQKNRIKFAIVTRGYRSHFEARGTEVKLYHSPGEVGDEAALFKHRFPQQDIYVGKNRKHSIIKALGKNNKIILLDDGFQSTDIYKDLKIMLVNPLHPYYFLRNFKWLMREEDWVFFYRTLLSCPPGGPVCGTYDFEPGGFRDREDRPVDTRGAALLGFSALGDNARFRNDLSRFNLVEFHGFNDHYAYKEKDLHRLNQRRIQVKADYLVCTEKDFMKIKPINFPSLPLIYVRNSIKLSFDLMSLILKYAKEKDNV
jgi:tetraacyldisaccharide 4'-kinase